ncbi:MAG: S-layer homology domain-containing protein [Raoultibacter sp.]
MTACVETQKKNLEGGALSNKIIRAILAIVLVIGLAPTLNVGTAYAADDQQAWDAATFTYNVAPDAKGEFHFAETTAPVEFALNSVALVDGTAVAATDYTVAYYTSADEVNYAETTTAGSGAAAEGAAPVNAGTYYIGTTKGAAVHYQKFAIDAPAKKSLATAVPYLVVADETDVSNVPVYNGAAFTIGQAEGNINFAIDGKPLTITTDYTVTGAVGADAKTYKITLTGATDYLGSTKYADVVVAPLDLSKTLVSFADQVWTGSAIAADKGLTINGKAPVDLKLDNKLEVAIIAYTGINTSGIPATVAELGHYTQSVAPKAGNTNVIGKASAEFNVVTKIAAPGDFKYTKSDGTAAAFSALTNLIFNASDAKDNTFVPANVSVAGLDAAKGEFTVVVTDKDGKVVTDWTAPGKYVATVQVTIDGATYAHGGKNTLPFTVIKGSFENDASVFVSLNGKNIASGTPATVTYTGKAFVPTVVIKDAAGKALVAGTDYMVAYKDSKSAVVTEIVAPDTYTIALTSDAYTLPAAVATGYQVTVNPLTITGYQIAQTKFDSNTTGIAATGEAIVPVVQYTAASDPVTKKPIWTTLDASLYTITYKDAKGVDVAAADLKAAGAYTATITLTTDAQKIYDAKGPSTAEFNIIDKTGFVDVAPSIWYAASVSKAAELTYMGGIGGNLFAPDASITRGEVACVVANMAGDHPKSQVNPFTDVSLGAFYGYEVCWAKQAGIMNGYMGTTLFGPYDQITREQFACTLYNYAKAYDKDITVDTKAELAKFPDSAQVSDFAQTAVAWAAKNKIMGNAGVLNPAAQVTRAEVAAMAVNFQPEKMK